MHLEQIETQAVKSLAEDAASKLAAARMVGDRDAVISWQMCGTVICSVRRSRFNAIWFNAIASNTKYDCVMMNSRRMPGRLVSARFDALDFVEWLTEEITEALIRLKIFKRINAQQRRSLTEHIMRESAKLASNPSNPLTVSWLS